MENIKERGRTALALMPFILVFGTGAVLWKHWPEVIEWIKEFIPY